MEAAVDVEAVPGAVDEAAAATDAEIVTGAHDEIVGAAQAPLKLPFDQERLPRCGSSQKKTCKLKRTRISVNTGKRKSTEGIM